MVQHPENIKTFVNMSAVLGKEAKTVPTFMFCGNSITGYDDKNTTGQLLKAYLLACYQFAREYEPDNGIAFAFDQDKITTVDIPLLGNVSAGDFSLACINRADSRYGCV